MNKWRLVSVILILTVLVLSFVLYKQQTEVYDFGKIQIKKTTANELSEVVGDFSICDINKDECIIMGRIKG